MMGDAMFSVNKLYDDLTPRPAQHTVFHGPILRGAAWLWKDKA